jgi:pimeloyl-ACP methyl ester carboxylesterase
MERVVTVKGHRVRYLAAGSGRALVLLHGLGESPADWSRSFPGSHRRGRLCAPALPGFDGQDEPADASAEDVEDVHPDEPAPDRAQPGVVGHHRQDADRPQPFHVGPEPIRRAHGRPPNPTARA